MTNPFEDADGVYVVLVNDENQHALWPQRLPAPAGWTQAFGPAARDACLAYVEETWKDMRPASLIRATE
ncbi:MbtH family protein [Nonomuraea sp. NPDC050790]|uniref:MbtH family protein n=1 Tax=Nonomuraea sp. NPDC050790 TaxID=3364371 RepID=UPI0037953C7F